MTLNENTITGYESNKTKRSSQELALIEFYRAFNEADIDLMSKNWMQTNEASMSNPLGGVKRGWESIKEVYDRIFSGSAKVYVEFYDYTIHHSGAMFTAVGRERGYYKQRSYFQQGKNKIDLSIRTSRTYQMECGRWQQIHHHGSIDSPALLEEYQSAVLKS